LDGPALRVDIVRQINNNPSSTWRAGINKRFAFMKMSDAKKLMGVRSGGPKLRVKKIAVGDLPDQFDAREQWGDICPSTKEIRDQAACGSCWAFGAVEAMTDRLCIASKGQVTPHLSAEDMNSCCDSCGFGCEGGFPSAAWDYWVSTGLVDGGNYGGDGCLPYSLPNCDHHTTGHYDPCGDIAPTPQCPNQCNDSAAWDQSKHFGNESYSVDMDVGQIQQEIFDHGPVEAAFTVYQDFLAYKSGVYQHTTGPVLGGHAVKILGWGTEDGTDYWLVANSWNEDWGDQGYFKILRGSDECGIEDGICAGMPLLQ
jgi:cathepsin B